MSGATSWLARQRKTDLVELAERVGLPGYENFRKPDLEIALDEYLAENAPHFQSDAELVGYFDSRARAAGSPAKREAPESRSRRRATRSADMTVDDEEERSNTSNSASSIAMRTVSLSQAVARTPVRAIAHAAQMQAARIPLPATPADVAEAVDRSSVVVRKRALSLYQDSGIAEYKQATREWLSSVTGVLFLVNAFETYHLRPALIPGRYAFTIPSFRVLGISFNDQAVHVLDVFALLSSSFWSPFLLWMLTSYALPSLFGYFFNLAAANHAHPGRGRPRASQAYHDIDPLAFSIAKAVFTYVVYAQGFTFWGAFHPGSTARINDAVYSGWQGVLAGCAATTVAVFYDAVLKK